MPTASAVLDPVADIHRRLSAGEQVGAADLAKAESVAHFAAVKERVAAEAAAAHAEAGRMAAIDALRGELPDRLSLEPVARARERLGEALDVFLVACTAHDTRLAAARDDLAALSPLPPGLDAGALYGELHDGATIHRLSRPQIDLHRLIHDALPRHFPRRRIDLNNPQD